MARLEIRHVRFVVSLEVVAWLHPAGFGGVERLECCEQLRVLDGGHNDSVLNLRVVIECLTYVMVEREWICVSRRRRKKCEGWCFSGF